MIKYNPYNWEIKKDKYIEDRNKLIEDNNTRAVQDFLNNLWKRMNHEGVRLGRMTVNETGAEIVIYFTLYK